MYLRILLFTLLIIGGNSRADSVNLESAEDNPSPWSIHGQFTFVDQWHPSFRSPYVGDNSLEPGSTSAQTSDVTLYIGRKLWTGAELYLNPEIDQGFGISNTLGLGGYSSGEAYKVGAQDPYFRFPRYFIRQTINLGGEDIPLEDDLNQVEKSITSNNLVITAGKFSVVDIFDTNKYAHDPRTDFLNWTALDAGAFDYAADAWGFTGGIAAEWTQDWWTLRSGYFLLSSVPNSPNIDTSFKQYELVEEFESRHEINGHDGKLKILGFMNHGNMASYQDAITWGIQNNNTPDPSKVRTYQNRMGIALNLEQEISPTLGFFARASMNDGSKETYDFTDVNQSVSFGISLKGNSWKRHQDTLGMIQIFNGLSGDAKDYFGQGGLGLLIGDGQLNYGTESISEIYYNMVLNNYLALGLDYQHVINPAYNKDRGPVDIFGFRVRLHF